MSFTGQIAPDGRRYALDDEDAPTTAPTPTGKMITHGALTSAVDAATENFAGLDILLDRTVADGVTTDEDATVTSATAAFTNADLGASVTGAGIPAGATIATINSGTSVELSAAATATDTDVELTIERLLAAVVSDHETRIAAVE